MSAAETPRTKYLTAARDRAGNIRMSGGYGVMVAASYHNRHDIQGWLDTAKTRQARQQYQAALDLLTREAAAGKDTP